MNGKPTSESPIEHIMTNEKLSILFQAVEQSSNAIIITDYSGSIEYVNPQFSVITGYTLAEVLGKNPRILQSGEMSITTYTELWATISSGENWSGEFHNRRKDNSMYWAWGSISPVKNHAGEITHFLNIQKDITERKKMEAELKQQKSELESTLQRLTQTQMTLIQREKMAGIGQLAAGVAHEINNPLGFIISNFTILERYSLQISAIIKVYQQVNQLVSNDDMVLAKELAANAIRQAKSAKLEFMLEDLPSLLQESADGLNRINQIIKGLQSFSRIYQSSEWEDYNLIDGIKNTLLLTHNEIEPVADVHLKLENIPLLLALGGQIDQVLLNIILNAAYAIKFSKRTRRGLIEITTWAEEKWVCCSIQDTGMGIPNHLLDKIFEPFFTTKPIGEGTGLGLGLAYDIIVNKHNGKITVDSVLGEGTTFTIHLPHEKGQHQIMS